MLLGALISLLINEHEIINFLRLFIVLSYNPRLIMSGAWRLIVDALGGEKSHAFDSTSRDYRLGEKCSGIKLGLGLWVAFGNPKARSKHALKVEAIELNRYHYQRP